MTSHKVPENVSKDATSSSPETKETTMLRNARQERPKW